jgi:hypothetical protein
MVNRIEPPSRRDRFPYNNVFQTRLDAPQATAMTPQPASDGVFALWADPPTNLK